MKSLQQCQNRSGGDDTSSVTSALLPIMAVVFIGFLIIGMALPVLPLHVHQGLGLSTFVVGLVSRQPVSGLAHLAGLVGHYADSARRQARRRRGFAGIGRRRSALSLVASLCRGTGFFRLDSSAWPRAPRRSGKPHHYRWRQLGTGARRSSKRRKSHRLDRHGDVCCAGLWRTNRHDTLWVGGFISIAGATALIPLVTLLLVAPMAAIPPHPGTRSNLLKLARVVWMPGLGSALSCIGFGTMIAFSSLFSVERSWQSGLASLQHIRGIPYDRALVPRPSSRPTSGAPRVALISIFIEATGLALIWLAPNQIVAVIGALLTGCGFALVYPGLGIEAVRRAPPQSRGLAMGAYTAFLDVALGFGSPALGLIAGWAGLSSVFLAGALLVLSASVIALRLLDPIGAKTVDVV